MAQDRPLWRAAIDSVDKVLGPASERLVRTEQFADAVAVVSRLRHELRRRSERAMRQQWHNLNLPAGSDVKRLSEQVASLERQVRQLTKRLEDVTSEEAAAHGTHRSDGKTVRTSDGEEVRPARNNQAAQPSRDRRPGTS